MTLGVPELLRSFLASAMVWESSVVECWLVDWVCIKAFDFDVLLLHHHTSMYLSLIVGMYCYYVCICICMHTCVYLKIYKPRGISLWIMCLLFQREDLNLILRVHIKSQAQWHTLPFTNSLFSSELVNLSIYFHLSTACIHVYDICLWCVDMGMCSQCVCMCT